MNQGAGPSATRSRIEARQVDAMLKSTTEMITAVVAKGKPVASPAPPK